MMKSLFTFICLTLAISATELTDQQKYIVATAENAGLGYNWLTKQQPCSCVFTVKQSHHRSQS